MKQQYKGRKTNKAQKPSRPFEGLIQQLNKERLVLVNFNKLPAFVQECSNRHIVVGLGSNYGDGKIVFKK
jgi:hypothetical protein